MLALLFAPVLNFHFFATVVIAIAVFFIVMWFVSTQPLNPPFNYVVYAVLAIVAIWLLFWFLRQT